MWLMTQGSRQLPASPVPKALLTSQPSRALWVRAAPQVPTCLMLAGCPQVCGPLMSPDTVQCPLRGGGGRRSISLERVTLASGREVTQAPQMEHGVGSGGHKPAEPVGTASRGTGLCSQPCGEAVRTPLRAGT